MRPLPETETPTPQSPWRALNRQLFLGASAILAVLYWRYSDMPHERFAETWIWWQEFLAHDNTVNFGNALREIMPGARDVFLMLTQLAPLTLAGFLLTARLRTGHVSLDLCAWGLYIFALIVAEILFLGLAGLLTAGALTFLHGMCYIVCLAGVLAPSVRADAGKFARDIFRAFIVTARDLVKSPLAWVLVVALLAQTLWIILYAFALDPTNGDVTKYHLPPLIRWWQEQRMIPVNLGNAFADCYPKNADLPFLFSLLVTGNIVFFQIVQCVSAAWGALAAFAAARLFQARARNALFAAAAFFLTPIVQVQASQCLVDVSTGACFLAAAVFLAAWWNAPSSGAMVAFATATGLALGMKYSMIAAAALLFAFFFLGVLLDTWRRRVSPRRAMASLVGVVLISVLLGAYWYVRNIHQFGNPLWPFEISAGDRVLLSGTHDLSWLTTLSNWSPRMANHWLAYDRMNLFTLLWSCWVESVPHYAPTMQAYGGLGAHWFIFGIPAVIALFVQGVRRRQAHLLVFACVLVLVFVFSAAPAVARYTLYLAGVGGVGIALALERLKGFQRIAYATCVLVVLLFSAFVATNNTNEHEYTPDLPYRLAMYGRSNYMSVFLEEYDRIVPSGSHVGFRLKKRREVFFLFGRDLSRVPEPLPALNEMGVTALKKYDYMVVPFNDLYDVELYRRYAYDRVGTAGPYVVYRSVIEMQREGIEPVRNLPPPKYEDFAIPDLPLKSREESNTSP